VEWFIRVQDIRRAHRKLGEFMYAEVAARKALIREQIANEMDEEHQASDVFSVLVRANELSEGKLKMDDSELVSKIHA
jgi:cytochrome P450